MNSDSIRDVNTTFEVEFVLNRVLNRLNNEKDIKAGP